MEWFVLNETDANSNVDRFNPTVDLTLANSLGPKPNEKFGGMVRLNETYANSKADRYNPIVDLTLANSLGPKPNASLNNRLGPKESKCGAQKRKSLMVTKIDSKTGVSKKIKG